MSLRKAYQEVRRRSEMICAPLKTEDYVVQPVVDVSPPKWHLGHTTWFFETFILLPNAKDYTEFDPQYNYVFNSYYESVGARVIRTNRGNLSRPAVEEVMRYRRYVDEAMESFLDRELSPELQALLVLGLNHEEQHQELLYTDIKYILGHNPLFPPYDVSRPDIRMPNNQGESWLNIRAGVYEIGFEGEGFCFDNELNRHKVYVNDYAICEQLVTNAEYLDFILAGGYSDFRFWHAEGWDWVKNNQVTTPMYWYNIDGKWMHYTWQGLQPLMPDAPVTHVSFYEAAAFAAWKGYRLPTEAEWEIAAPQLAWGQRWEWTESAYLPYPGFTKAPGAIGEYNGKFMVNQMVLRGASEVTPPGHSRITYRNFFHPPLRWQFTGIRLAR
ncbi:ergothioneine biosynthesis protein EgtB [Chitinophaga terrae (ex Kim and Jung 2007)]|uniref:Ergothioneine biosynthesis protein EgtB n=1 Tax=Chitinophaga terrae (ex Kim and Jung 2007) TaxID=408074 RepID=A0A1H3ZAW8_9BACT|nr:ergothioneine biosynthesis protein EgtB [Chitinophaga terrae (ex Kim and Jung 2007)]GEP88660.1 ergothioneine biosynthesis protein EgtB [Chitinophaga terrae (ex Kim and Jung 2007)]SEA20929.1 ergothioneine biosynthesis protein EgtB [Chitinophaga terrae (ex Kim and Jung 2007)]